MNKYCRICWNTNNWRSPSGDARRLETKGSHVFENGFGFEEWLFNFSWLLHNFDSNDSNAYRYGFLQPIGKYLSKYQKQTFSVLLYTVSPQKVILIVARINNLYVPMDEELNWSFDQIKRCGWHDEMKQDLQVLGIMNNNFDELKPPWVVNVRFRPEDVFFYDPMLVVKKNHKLYTINRYQPLDWNDLFPSLDDNYSISSPPEKIKDDYDPERIEKQRFRATVNSTIYDPRHIKLQNQLYRFLCKQYGKNTVFYEKDFVDLSYSYLGQLIYIEIKMEFTVKRCIRLALGQLLEYSHYPNFTKANKLLIVGEVPPVPNDIEYLNYLRRQYNLLLYYARWNWKNNCLDTEI